jgi:hypothetical protein
MADPKLIDDGATAFHEAGHAVVGALRGRPPISATILPDGDGAAGTTVFPEDFTEEFRRYLNVSPEKQKYVDTRILTEVAATIAHDLHEPDRTHDQGDECDDRRARDFVSRGAGWVAIDGREAYLQRQKDVALDLLCSNWAWVEAVANALLQKRTISGEEVLALRP